MSNKGRKPNENFIKLKFDLIKHNNKPAAKCSVCGNIVKNTGASRLQSHRNVCPLSRTRIMSRVQPEGKPTPDSVENALLYEYDVVEDGSLSLVLDSSSTTTRAKNATPGVPDEKFTMLPSTSRVYDMQSSNSFSPKLTPGDENCLTTNNSLESNKLNYSFNIADSTDSDSHDNIITTPTTSGSGSCKRPSLFSTKTKPRLSKRAKKITDYVDILHEQEEERITDALAKFIFGCNLPFSVVESPLFKNFIKTIRPAYLEKIPGRKRLSTTLLEKCYKDCIDSACRTIETESVILVDGWKNSSSNTKTVVTMLQNTDGENAFIDAWDLTTESETGEQLATIISTSREIAKEKYNVDGYCIVSDNASPMVKMGSLLKHSMWHSTCNSHTGNLLAKDVLDKKLVENVILVLKEFKQPDLERLIVNNGGHRIKLPAETRWCSYRNSFKSLLDNFQHMKQIVAVTKKKIKPKVTELLFNDSFIDEVQQNLELHDPICSLINTCQSSDTSVADAVYLWLNLKLPAAFKEKLKHRQEMALNVYSLSAYYLHPTYDKSKLTSDHRKKINEFLFKTLNNQGIEEWDQFNIKSGIFATLFQKGIKKPLTFWRMAKMECPILSELALKLLRIPASSAQIERLFSNWGHVHTLLRNRLTFENSKKLAHIYFSLKSQHFDANQLDSESEDEFV